MRADDEAATKADLQLLKKAAAQKGAPTHLVWKVTAAHGTLVTVLRAMREFVV